MNVDIKFRKINGDYSQEYADFHEDGKESISNPKHSPVWVLKLNDIEEISLEPCQNHTVTLVDPNGAEKEVTLKDMCLLNCIREEDKSLLTFGVSRSALEAEPTKRPVRNYTNDKAKTITQYFDIKADAELMELWNGFYVNVNELPIELRA